MWVGLPIRFMISVMPGVVHPRWHGAVIDQWVVSSIVLGTVARQNVNQGQQERGSLSERVFCIKGNWVGGQQFEIWRRGGTARYGLD